MFVETKTNYIVRKCLNQCQKSTINLNITKQVGWWKYKEGNNRPSSVIIKSLVNKHNKPGINVTPKTTRTLVKPQSM